MESECDGDDRRVWYRMDCALTGECSVDGKGSVDLEVRDISFDGIGFVVRSDGHDLQAGDRAEIILRWDDLNETWMDAVAILKYVNGSRVGAQWVGRPRMAKLLIGDLLP
ncbi:MAG: hypothetical protein EOM25_07040 [Deltaproteobacteria bacterium]|nr:hypothetical protein [Deltaproteobacteria bacterium]